MFNTLRLTSRLSALTEWRIPGVVSRPLVVSQRFLSESPKIATTEDAEPAEVMPSLQASKLSLKPKEIVAELDRYIVGQKEAKKAVAIAMRNRWRRQQIEPESMKEEIIPKNILMVGPTGCGKTEIARRLARLADAPFIKVEATKFTEVGFHGRDVDMIIRDLMDAALVQTRKLMREEMKEEIKKRTEDFILKALVGGGIKPETGGNKESFRKLLRDGLLETKKISFDVPANLNNKGIVGGMGGSIGDIGIALEKVLGNQRQTKSEKKTIQVKDARKIIEDMEAEKLLSDDNVQQRAIQSVEQSGIVFLDELDKICSSHGGRGGPDASDEGVQRDLLPLIEGTTIQTKYGNIKTDHILFVASGAFHSSKPSDLLAELQGRLPIRVELHSLSKADFVRVLKDTEYNLPRQHIALMKTEGVDLKFTDEALEELASVSVEINSQVENIGARRLHTVMEKIMEDYSFDAPDLAGEPLLIDEKLVREKVGDMLASQDLSKFIL